MATIPVEKREDPVRSAPVVPPQSPPVQTAPAQAPPVTMTTKPGEVIPQGQRLVAQQRAQQATLAERQREAEEEKKKKERPEDREKTQRERELERALQMKSDEITHRFTELKKEMSLERGTIKENTVLAVGAAVVVGGLAWWVLGRKGRKQKKAAAARPPERHELLEQYMDLLIEEAGADVAAGEDVEKAFRKALRRNKPVILYAPRIHEPSTPKSTFGDIFDFVAKSLIGFGVKYGMDALTNYLVGEDLEEAVKE